jgi:hypothetical protein
MSSESIVEQVPQLLLMAFEMVVWGRDLRPFSYHPPAGSWLALLSAWWVHAGPHALGAVTSFNGYLDVSHTLYLSYIIFLIAGQLSFWWLPYLFGWGGADKLAEIRAKLADSRQV